MPPPHADEATCTKPPEQQEEKEEEGDDDLDCIVGYDSGARSTGKEEEPLASPAAESSSSSSSSKFVSAARAALRVVRAKGVVWLGDQQSHWLQGTASLAGPHFSIGFETPWAASHGKEESGGEIPAYFF